ncbi:endonuclease III [candidate division WWE3 bacterium]|nr:endonuclease III [candidate division WWE3 bacterium]
MDNLELKDKAKKIFTLLHRDHPNPKTELIYKNEMELSIAVALSAQTTDKKVNEITQRLFKKYTGWEDFAKASIQELQQDIRGVNFHMGKAQRLIKMAQKVISDFGGNLPREMHELITLPGFARKSSNVVMQELWGKAEGIVVDTHVTRVSNRLGLTTQQDAIKIEKELMAIFPKESWRVLSGSMVLHGRYVCKAIKPNCLGCSLNKICPSAFKI